MVSVEEYNELVKLLERVQSFSLGKSFYVNGVFRESGIDEMEDYLAERRRQREGPDKWAITHGSRVCYSKSLNDFVYETSPSSRTDETLADTRFNSFEECFEIFQKWRAEKLAALRADPHWIEKD